jgi:RNase H-fold protein (predicted Holliday junction resolvase)
LAAALSKKTGVVVEFVDERLSTRMAGSQMIQSDRKKNIDNATAQILLQEFLDQKNRTHLK